MYYWSSLYQKAVSENAKQLERELKEHLEELKTTLEEQKMNKVIVNKEVAGLLQMVDEDVASKLGISAKVTTFLEAVPCEWAETDDWLERNNISHAEIVQAFKYGWEAEYEFKEGDLVSPKHGGRIFEVYISTKEGIGCVEKINLFSQKALAQKDELKLICKKENREDLK